VSIKYGGFVEGTLADTIREITQKHLTQNNGLLLGQAISAIGWVNNTVPSDCEGIVELSMADVSGAGIAVGTAIAGRRPIFTLRFGDFVWLASSPLVNYVAKSKEIFGVGIPIFIRAIADENYGLGIVHSACLHSIIMHIPGMRVCSPMTSGEYEEIWRVFMANDEPIFVSEHRQSFTKKDEMRDITVDNADITIYAISLARFNALDAVALLKTYNIKSNLVHIVWLKPFELSERILKPLRSSKWGLVVDSDYEIAGASEHIAYRLMEETGLPVRAFGRQDKSMGISQHLIHGTPTTERIVDKVVDIMKGRAK
jgi:pyruvate/2-oxoglutarate/acetoin dehydrogenase E1 component